MIWIGGILYGIYLIYSGATAESDPPVKKNRYEPPVQQPPVQQPPVQQPPVQQPPVQPVTSNLVNLEFREVLSGRSLDFSFETIKKFGRGDFEEWLRSGLLNSAELNHISRNHFMIREKSGSLFIRDMKSSNGTMLNGTKLKPGAEFQLRNGDALGFYVGSGRTVEVKLFVR